jgi:hypothetical protein
MQANNKKNPARERPDLDCRYGAIGISAVAAAVRYQGETNNKNQGDVTADAQRLYEREEVAA